MISISPGIGAGGSTEKAAALTAKTTWTHEANRSWRWLQAYAWRPVWTFDAGWIWLRPYWRWQCSWGWGFFYDYAYLDQTEFPTLQKIMSSENFDTFLRAHDEAAAK